MFRSMRAKYLIIFILTFTFITGLLTAAFYNIVTDNIEQITIEESLEKTQLYANDISQSLQYHIGALKILSSQYEVQNKQIKDNIPLLKELISSPSYIFNHVYFVDIQGTSYRIDGTRGTVTDRKYYTELLSNDKDYYISEVVMGRFVNEPACHISVPIRDELNDLTGILVGTLPLRVLSEELINVKHTGNSFGWIIDENGHVIAHPKIDFTSNININELAKQGYAESTILYNQLMNEEQGIGEHYSPLDDANRIVTFTTIENSPGWKLGITTKKQDILSFVTAIRELILVLFFIVLVISIYAATLVTNNFVKPILKLTEAMAYSKPFHISSSGLQNNNELLTLEKVYNNMRQAIEQHTNELETLVYERTKELKIANDNLKKIAREDKLTGVSNRGHLYDELKRLEGAVQDGNVEEFTLLFIDINNFKYYNDTFGHDVGDKILIKLVKLFSNQLKGNDIIGRYGGDEFVILLTSVSSINVQNFINDLIKRVSALDSFRKEIIQWQHLESVHIPRSKTLGISVGHSHYNKNVSLSGDDLIKVADQSMYKMKQELKNKE